MMRKALLAWLLAMAILAAAASYARGAEEGAAIGRAVVLDTSGFWRLHHTLSPPVIDLPTGLKPVLINAWLDRETPAASAGWADVGFDDSTWLRGPARIVCRTPYLARVCLRGSFGVTDPDQVQELALSLAYHGGAIVRVNGREVGRMHLPKGDLDGDALAEPYPREAFVAAGGGLLVDWDLYKAKPDEERDRRLVLRERRINRMPIPSDLLRAGRNVLAVEVIRAPYDQAVEDHKDATPGRKGCVYNLAFNTCELMGVQLSAAASDGLVPAVPRPNGLQVWNSDVMASDFDLDFAGPHETLYPLKIVGVRNGLFSGKVVVGSDAPIEGLRAEASHLESGSNSIPAAAIRVRYGVPWGDEWGLWGKEHTYWDVNCTRYARRPTLLGALAESALELFPVSEVQPTPGSDLAAPGQPAPVFGAVVPVWVTVRVPRDAPPGDYRGRLTIRAESADPIEVPVELRVVDWTLPDPADWRTWTEVIQVPDTSAVEYDVPLWSEQHWRMIAHAFDLIGETSSRVVHVPLICHTNLGNAESMVRWIKRPDGGYYHDFSVMDRYVDTACEHMGQPKLVVLQAWDTYMMQEGKLRPSSSHDQEQRSLKHLQSLDAELGTGPVVTLLDPVTGACGPLTLPPLDDPRTEALWQPVFDGLLARMKKRGLTERLALGLMSDAWPTRDEALLFSELSGGLPWVSHSHMGVRNWKLHDVADVVYQSTVTQNRFANDDPPSGSKYGWKEPRLFVEYARGTNYIECPASRMRHCGEFNITGGQRGVGRMGADFWKDVRDRHGRRRGTVAARYPQSSWRNLDLFSTLLAPGPDGPVASHRFEAFREGLQECEARIAIEQALTDDALRATLGEDLASECQDALVERTHYMIKSLGQMKLTGPAHWYVTVGYTYWHRSPGPVGHQWFLGSGWQERSEKLYGLAAQVEKRLAD